MLAAGMGAAPLTIAAGPAAHAQTQARSGTGNNLERILSSKKLRVAGIVGEEPNYSKDIVTGSWSGFCIDMAKNMADELGVDLEVLETTWGNSILDLQSDKIDISFGLTPTPKRALVTDFSRPMYYNTFCVVAKKGFSASTWDDLNNPKVTIAVDIGSSHEAVARRFAKNANILAFKTRDEAVLAVASGRADCFVCTVFLGLISKKKNPQLGSFIMPRPYVETLVSAALQYDLDGRFRDFVNTWCDFNRSAGQVREWVIANLAKVGLEPGDIPAEVRF
ncbi:transporter substrate-binding domain-containing protein [Bradyrhizobium sp. U531]|uniref:transporter substrate-binding domain-containing protein n=1 Tax=Bradyrhizobium sp. U531 TaxID=3053458 RepID=UPI003F43E9B4